MLSAIRKFSSSIFAKIFLFIVAIPFIFWGMGPVFQGGKLNTIAEIGNKKISTEEFVNFVRYNSPDPNLEKLDKNLIEKLLSRFIGEKLISLEIESHEIRLSDNSLSSIIKNQENFRKNDEFSRIEYEKFLVKNSLSAVAFETNMSYQVKKDQLFDLIGGGVVPSKFLVNLAYDKINQKRNIEVIDLSDVLKKKSNFSEDQIKLYFNKNKETYNVIYRSIKYIELNQKNLTGNNEYDDLFFQKIDEIDDLIVEGNNLDFIINRFNLEPSKTIAFDELGQNNNLEADTHFPNQLTKKVFDIYEEEPTVLIEHENKYFVIELIKIENIQKKITEETVRKEILQSLEKQTKRKFISKIIEKINKNSFKKKDFNKLSNDENVVVKKIKLEGLNDDKILKKDLVKQIYDSAEKKVIVVVSLGLEENFLIYIDKIENALIDQNSDDYKKYFNLSKVKMTNDLYNTYNSYLEKKYEININYKALDNAKNYF